MNKIFFIGSRPHAVEKISSQLKNKFDIELIEKEKLYLTKYKSARLVFLEAPINENVYVCKELRDRGVTIPIIAFSKSDSMKDKIKALDLGADDIIDEQIDPEEFRAKISSILRRPSNYFNKIISVSDIKIDLTNQLVLKGNQKIELRKKEFELLDFLIKHQGKAVSRDKILNELWRSDEEPYSNSLDVHIANLRKKLGKDPYKVIKTAYGIGYKIKL